MGLESEPKNPPGTPPFDGAKFYGNRPAWRHVGVSGSDMKIEWSAGAPATLAKVNAILDRHVPGRSTLAQVDRELEKLGAWFAPCTDGKSGHAGNWGAGPGTQERFTLPMPRDPVQFSANRRAWNRVGGDMVVTWDPGSPATVDKVNAVLDAHPPGRATLQQVEAALKKLGARFEPWPGGGSGHAGNWSQSPAAASASRPRSMDAPTRVDRPRSSPAQAPFVKALAPTKVSAKASRASCAKCRVVFKPGERSVSFVDGPRMGEEYHERCAPSAGKAHAYSPSEDMETAFFEAGATGARAAFPRVPQSRFSHVDSVFAQNPPGRATLEHVKRELAKLGAHFVPYSDGAPGDNAYRPEWATKGALDRLRGSVKPENLQSIWQASLRLGPEPRRPSSGETGKPWSVYNAWHEAFENIVNANGGYGSSGR